MKLYLMPKEPTWWTWLATLLLLLVGVAGVTAGFAGAVVLSLIQTVVFLSMRRSVMPYPVQIRLAYTCLVLICFLPCMRWLYWLPLIGTAALVLFGYCLLARTLSLMPWNRTHPISTGLLVRTFFSAPVASRPEHGLPGAETVSICELEARVGGST